MKNIGRAITKIEEFVLSFSVIAMAALLILGVFMRTVMNSSLTFSEEVASALLIVVSFFGLGYCARQGRHITMSIVFDMLNNRQKKVFMIFISLISAIAMVFIVYLAFRYVIHEIEMATQELVKDIFHAKYADLRPIGGHMAGMSVVLAMLEPGDHVIEVSLADWGHGLVAPMCQVRQFDAT